MRREPGGRGRSPYPDGGKPHGNIDIAVAAVGAGSFGSIDETGGAALLEALSVNSMGPFQFTRHAARHMKDSGFIILFTTGTSTDVMPGSVAYSCAKRSQYFCPLCCGRICRA